MRRFLALVLLGVIASLLPVAPVAPSARGAVIPTTTTLSVPASPAQSWVSTTLIATVSPTPSDWTHVMFWSGTEVLGDAVLDAQGQASWTRSWGFAPGTTNFRATYAGDDVHGPSESASQNVTFEDNRSEVAVTLAVSPSAPTIRGDSVTLDIGVAPNPHGGEIDIYWSSGSLLAQGLELGPSGTLQTTLALGGVGTYQLRACFSGTDAYKDACSTTVPHESYRVPTTTTLTIEPATVYPDEVFTLGVTITPVPDDEAFVWVGTWPGSHTVAIPIDPITGHGEVVVMPSSYTWSLGQWDLRAYFEGTYRYAGSTSDAVSLTVRLDSATLDAAVTQGAAVGDPLTFSAAVLPVPTDPTAGVGFRVSGPPESGFGDSVGFTLGSDGTGSKAVDTDGWPAGDYWYDATFGGDPQLASTTVRGFFTLTDVDAPTGSVEVAPETPVVITNVVAVNVPATDGVGSGVTAVALSNDGTSWTQRAYAPSVRWALAAGDGTRTVWAKWRDQAGNWSAATNDSVTVSSALGKVSPVTARFSAGTTVTSGTIPVRVTWSAGGLASLAGYRVERSTDGGAWAMVSASTRAGSLVAMVPSGHSYRFRVRAIDNAGGTGAPSTSAAVAIRGYQESSTRLEYSGRWAKVPTTAAWGGALRSSATKGDAARFIVTGKGAAWVSRMGPLRGSATVWVNDVKVASVSLYSTTWKPMRVVWSANWTASATRKVEIRVVGTSGRPRVEVDGFLALN